MQNRINIPNELKKMDSIFQKHGFNAYLVGGAVRDIIRGKKAADWDIATDATPEQVVSIFNKVIPTGIAHGTVTVIFMGQHIEVTTFRSEEGYSDGRHPDTVTFGTDLTIDLSRR
ncbi:MAG: polynucleotide adenylyltransferase, partial [Spirochaetaceae bacterium]|nr:polynucleotide adenylyltransferase [Spirochaetaceae bacterium]